MEETEKIYNVLFQEKKQLEQNTEPKEKLKMMALPEGVHTRLKALKRTGEPFYSVITRLMDNYAQIEQKEVKE